MLFALRPAAAETLTPPQRLPLIAQTLQRFFAIVWACVILLLLTGLAMLLAVGMKNAPAGWHAMLGIGLVMFALFGHLYFGPFRRLKQAVSAAPRTPRRTGNEPMPVWRSPSIDLKSFSVMMPWAPALYSAASSSEGRPGAWPPAITTAPVTQASPS